MTATGTEPLLPLTREALTVRRLRLVIEAVIMLTALTGATLVVRRWVDVPLWPLVAVILVGIGLAWWWAGVDHARWSWRLTERLFEVRRGVLFRRRHLVPRSRIQNVTTTAGPLQRRFGLVTLTVHTAGARTRNVSIEDLDAGYAEGIRRRMGLT